MSVKSDRNVKPPETGVIEGVELSISLNRWIMRVVGIWPRSSNDAWLEHIMNRTLNALCYGLLAFILIPCGMYFVLEIKDVYSHLKLGSALSFFVMAVIKYSTLIVREDEIRKCMSFIEADWRNIRHLTDRRIMLDNASFGRKLILVCGVFMYGGVLFYYMALPLTSAKIAEEGCNVTYRRLVYPVSKIIADTRYSPMNEIFYCLQLLSGLVAHNITVGACGLAAVLAMHACGQLQILMSWMEHLVDGRKNVEDTVDQRLADVVEQHVRALNLIAMTEQLMQEISLVEIVGCTLNMCFLGYYSMTEWDFKEPVSGLTYVILLISVTFNIFIFCYIGELLAEQSIKVGQRSYMIDWYRLADKKRLGLILMMSMSNSSTKMSAGNIVELSVSSFGDVIKTSVAYLNMLRTFTT